MNKIAIIDDEKNFARLLALNLESEGFLTNVFFSGEEFLKFLENDEPDVVLLDLNLPDNHGLNIFNYILKTSPLTQVIVITAHGDMETAVEAVNMGCFDYINKPFGTDEIIVIIKRALEKKRLLHEINFRRRSEYEKYDLQSFVGSCDISLKLKDLIKTIALADDATVLINGESGTGKNLVARIIHNLSSRKDKPFVEINCASIPESLFESEIFGYEKGAFTDAKGSKKGLLEIADGGTFFLDEVGELPMEVQAKFLSFLESKKFRKVGGVVEIKANVRIIASTNKDLKKLVEEKKFRQDLFYRLNVLSLRVPTLLERQNDIVEISNFFLEQYNKKYHKKLAFSEAAKKRILKYPWPGNVRELKNVIERAVILTHEGMISENEFPVSTEQLCFLESEKIDDVEKQLILRAMKECGNVKQKAAEKLGISRYALLRKLKKYNLL